MTDEELEGELDRLGGDGFERTVIEAYKRALIGRTFQFGDTDTIWFFKPQIGDDKSCELFISKSGESILHKDWYVFYADNNKIYLKLLSKTYEFETYSCDENDRITATIRLGENIHLLHQIVE